MAGSPYRGVTPDINSPDARMPTNKELGFNPKGLGGLATGLLDPIGGIFAVAADRAAREATRKVYPGAVGSHQADAFRHGAGSGLVRVAIGEARAKNFGDAHEVDGIDPSWIEQAIGYAHKNTEGQRAMDLYNNQVGRALPRVKAQDLQNAIGEGRFRLRPFGE